MGEVTVKGLKIHYLEQGAGQQTICFVHGAGGNGGIWSEAMARLADRAHLIAIDLPGHGMSGGKGCRTIQEYTDFVVGLADALRLERFVLAGHSMGGAISQTVALQNPQRLAGLLLVGTGARLRVAPQILQLLLENPTEAFALLDRYSYSPKASPELISRERARTASTPVTVTHGDFSACDVFDVLPRVREITVPTLVICGRDDKLTPVKYSEYLAREIKGSRLVLIDDAGHMVQVEQPDAFAQAVGEWLGGLR